jgi:hypothetical protein
MDVHFAYRQAGLIPSLSGTPAKTCNPAPGLGQHNKEAV